VSVVHDLLDRLISRVSAGQPDAAPNARKIFEARYENELFLADELLSRGGANSPEDHVWLNKLMTAYEASSDAVYDASENIPDPWAQDTLAEVFETTPADLGADTSTADPPARIFSVSNDEDPIAQARELRKEAVRVRKHLRPAMAALVHEREQLRRAVTGAWDIFRSLRRGGK